MTKAFEQEWNMFINELDTLMDKTPGNITRIVDCTIKEEWRNDHGYSPFDGDMDDDIWRATYEYLEGDLKDTLSVYWKYAERCGLDAATMKLKYPLIATAMEL